jgi:hypothetical protein
VDETALLNDERLDRQSYEKAGDTLQTHVYILKVLANKRLGKLPITSSRSRRWRILRRRAVNGGGGIMSNSRLLY